MTQKDFHTWVDGLSASGAELLDQLHAALVRYVILPTPEAADAVTLYIAATHAQPAWEHATRLVVKSPLKRCGKTRLQEVCRETAHNPLPTTNISPAALARSISEENPPTLILDEADAVWGKRDQRTEGAEDLRGILNSGHSRGWPYIRWDATSRRRETCVTFAMAVIGGIGDMPDTIEDRAVVIAMRRRAPGEKVRQWRTRRARPELHNIRDRLRDWVLSKIEILETLEPELPAEDRAADVWEPLVAIADVAGEGWPHRARQACKALAGTANQDDPHSAGERLLADLRAVFAGAGQLPTAAILDRLAQIEEAPWATWHRGERLSPRALAGLLRPYGVRSRKLRVGDSTPNGYRLDDLLDSWQRYVPEPGTPVERPEQPELQPETPWSDPVPDGVPPSPTTPGTRPDQAQRTSVPTVPSVPPESPKRVSDYCRQCGMTPATRHTASCPSGREPPEQPVDVPVDTEKLPL